LDDDSGGAETGDDPVSRREPPGRRLDSWLVLRDDQPAFDDPTGQITVHGGIVAVDAAAEYGGRDPSHVERAPVCLSIDAPGHPAHDDEARPGELAAQRASHGT